MNDKLVATFLIGGTTEGGVFGIEKLSTMSPFPKKNEDLSPSRYRNKFGGICSFYFLDTFDSGND